MPVITKITSQRQKGRYNIFIDHQFAFGLDEDTLVAKGLQKGQKLTRFEMAQLEKQSDIGKLLQKALRFLEVRPRSEFEVRERLRQKIWQNQSLAALRNLKQGDRAIETVIKKLRSLGYLDDEEFAKWWVQQRRSAKNPKGKRLIKAELVQKGIAPEIIRYVFTTAVSKIYRLGGFGESEREDSSGEEGLALRSAQKKLRLRAYQKLSSQELKRKMGAYLARRGFNWEVIQKVLPKLSARLDTNHNLA